MRVFAILMFENRELTGNFSAKLLIQIELTDALGILEAGNSLITKYLLMY